MTAREFPRDDGRYVVTVPMAFIRCGARYVNLFEGDRVPAGIDPKQRERLLRGGMIALRPDAEPDPVPAPPARAPDYESVD